MAYWNTMHQSYNSFWAGYTAAQSNGHQFHNSNPAPQSKPRHGHRGHAPFGSSSSFAHGAARPNPSRYGLGATYGFTGHSPFSSSFPPRYPFAGSSFGSYPFGANFTFRPYNFSGFSSGRPYHATEGTQFFSRFGAAYGATGRSPFGSSFPPRYPFGGHPFGAAYGATGSASFGASFQNRANYNSRNQHQNAAKGSRGAGTFPSSGGTSQQRFIPPAQPNQPNYYAVLGVSRNATKQEIEKAYKNLALKHHPDRENGNKEIFQRINAAKQVLVDPIKRAQYDRSYAT